MIKKSDKPSVSRCSYKGLVQRVGVKSDLSKISVTSTFVFTLVGWGARGAANYMKEANSILYDYLEAAAGYTCYSYSVRDDQNPKFLLKGGNKINPLQFLLSL